MEFSYRGIMSVSAVPQC